MIFVPGRRGCVSPKGLLVRVVSFCRIWLRRQHPLAREGALYLLNQLQCVVPKRAEALGGRGAATCMFHVCFMPCQPWLRPLATFWRCSGDRLFRIWRNVPILLPWGGCGQKCLPQASPRDAEHDSTTRLCPVHQAAEWLRPRPSGNVT